jgi:excisionase family DNA binding protein
VSIGSVTARLLTAAEVASVLGVPKSWVYEQSLRGLIPTVELGRYRRFREEAIERMVEQLEHGTSGRGSGGALRWRGAAATYPRRAARLPGVRLPATRARR